MRYLGFARLIIRFSRHFGKSPDQRAHLVRRFSGEGALLVRCMVRLSCGHGLKIAPLPTSRMDTSWTRGTDQLGESVLTMEAKVSRTAITR